MTGHTAPVAHGHETELSPREALACLLIASARADGSVSPHEANQIEHVTTAMKLFRGCSYETRQRLFTSTAERINQHGVDAVAHRAAVAVPQELAATVFAVAVDLMLSGGALTASERHFTDQLRALLNVDSETAAKIVDVLTIKNAG